MWDDYAVPGGTYRENLLGTPGHPGVPEGHPAGNFKYDVLKEKYGDENGDIIINRKDEPKAEPAPVVKPEEAAPVVETEKLDIKQSPAAVSSVEVTA